ncbi:MAG: hypothetical protein QOG42_1012 [Solirubrobacteraceae bacterium]|nr:hypothetical protein [Solirubrobacteraceae bacterium]
MRRPAGVAGSVLALVAVLAGTSTVGAATARCVGAAARDPRHPCTNLSRTVSPKKGDVGLIPATLDCKRTPQRPRTVCVFGASPRRPKATVALVGDSHALHWRAAIDVVAKARRWRGYSITTAACPFSAVRLAPGFRELCDPWYAQARTWFADHPEVSTVFVSQKSDTPVSAVAGKTEAQVRAAGLRRAWSRLPGTVKRVVVLRDVPDPRDDTFACIDQALATGTPRLGVACPTPRAVALRPDAAIAAARSLASRRYRAIDLSSLFCTVRMCYPVIGGVQVYSDVLGHITAAYMRTVAPYLLRRLGG